MFMRDNAAWPYLVSRDHPTRHFARWRSHVGVVILFERLGEGKAAGNADDF
jgi:hypothetical protein